ncbi:MAG: hypothetical protein AB1656_23980 [Candidatus Omnitrophota bacterium]
MNDTSDNVLYPPPPWRCSGSGLIVFRAIPAAQTQAPPHCAIQCILPGRTLGGYYIAQYYSPLAPGEPEVWHEWGNVACYARYAKIRGLHIDAMAVDSPAAYKGGREIWGLNKTMGKIEIAVDGTRGEASLNLGENIIIMRWREFGFHFPFQRVLNYLTFIQDAVHAYSVVFRARCRLCRVEIVQQPTQEFSVLTPGSYFGLRFDGADVEISSPRKIS